MPNTTRRIQRRPALPAPVTIERPRADADPQRAGLRILRRPDVEQLTGLRRSAIYQAIAEGRFPRPVNLGPKAVGWVEAEIDRWVAERIAARDARRV
jgi:prophage regulatory protein